MNFINLICNKCECKDKDIFTNIYNKESKSSLINQKIEMQKEEIISNDSTNNLEIIEYPYPVNLREDYISKLACNNYKRSLDNNYFIYEENKIQKIEEEKEKINNYNSIFNSNKNSLNNSSLIMNNEDSLVQNKALLSRYYANCQNLKNQNIRKQIVSMKNINPENKNFSFKNKNKGYKQPLKIETYEKNKFFALLSNENNKSNKQIKSNEKISKKKDIFRSNNNKDFDIKKFKTNYKFNKKNENSKSDKNMLLMRQKQNDKDKNLYNSKLSTYNAVNNKSKKSISKNSRTPINKSAKTSTDKNSGVKKDIFKKYNNSNNVAKKYINCPKLQLSNSSSFNDNSYIMLNKNYFLSYRNTTTDNIENKKNHLDFSYLWLNNKGFQSLSRSYINPFDKGKKKHSRNIKKNI
jgi:hypothetical protein